MPQRAPVDFATKNARRREAHEAAKAKPTHERAARRARRERRDGAFGSCPATRFNWMAFGTTAALRNEKHDDEDDVAA